jgi:hypothetical protein
VKPTASPLTGEACPSDGRRIQRPVACRQPFGERNGQHGHRERTKAGIAERQKFSALLNIDCPSARSAA